MFSELPFFLGLGFCLGLIWPAVLAHGEPPPARPLAPDDEEDNLPPLTAMSDDEDRRPLTAAPRRAETELSWSHVAKLTPTRAVAALLAVLFVWASHNVNGSAPARTGLCLSALVVGWAGGRWFADSDAGRDKIVAVAAAALFVAVAAYEYDTHGLRNITKFSAGSVDLELSSSRSSLDDAGRTASLVKNIESKPFPGRNRLERAIAFLKGLPKTIARDEQYAELFSGYDRDGVVAGAKPMPILEPVTQKYLDFYYKTILPLVCKFDALQQFHKGEVSSISLSSSLVYDFRLAYERNLMLAPQASPMPGQTPAAGAQPANPFAEAYNAASEEVDIDQFHSTPAAKPDDPCLNRAQQPSPPPEIANSPTTDQDARSFIAYFAITAALTEFAIDNRERAIQLLDDVVVHPSPYLRKGVETPQKPSEEPSEAFKRCAQQVLCEAAARRLETARGFVLRARLEQVMDSIIEVSDNPALTAIRISLVKRAVQDWESLLSMFKPEGGFDRQAFFGGKLEVSGAGCRLQTPRDKESRGRLARWIAAETTFRANALQAAADRPDVVAARPFLIPTLDAYAAIVTSFDADCAAEWINADPESKSSLLPNLRTNLLETVARYWEAKANRFGAPAEAGTWLADAANDAADQIRALCQAEKTFQFGGEIYDSTSDAAGEAKADEDITLDERGNAFGAPSLRERMQAGVLRAKLALGKYAAGDVDKYCR